MGRQPVLVAAVVALGAAVNACGGEASDASDTPADLGQEADAGGAQAIESHDAGAGSDSGASGEPEASHSAEGMRMLFYLDIGAGRVASVDPDVGVEQELVAAAGVLPDGIAIDLDAGHLYWTTMGLPAAADGTLMRADLDGGNLTTVVAAGLTTTPKQMKIDLGEGKLYWSDREGMRVMRANLDGSELETLVTVATGPEAAADAANHCVGMALDEPNRMVYWTQKGPDNGGVGSIRRASFDIPAGETSEDRSDIEVLFEGLPEPIDLELDLERRLIYWTDRGDDTVNRAPMDEPTAADREILVTDVPEAIGIALDLHAGEMFYTSLETGVVAAANLDGSNAHDIVDSAGSLVGIAVAYVKD